MDWGKTDLKGKNGFSGNYFLRCLFPSHAVANAANCKKENNRQRQNAEGLHLRADRTGRTKLSS